MKKIALIFLAMLLPMMASALAFTVNGLSYEHLGGLTQAVRLIGYVTEECPSDVIIPATVSDGDRTYSVDNISSGAFWGCTNLRSVFMENDAAGNGVKYIDANSFSGCTNLKYVRFSKTLNAILGPGWSHEIGAFEGCTSLESIYLPASMNYLIDENVTAPHNICKWAFKNCTNLKTVVIAAKKPYIEDEAFINCPSLSYLISYVNPPYQLADNTFKGLSSNASLIVPDGTKSGYQSFAGWSDFRNIYEHGSYTNAFAFVTATQGGKVTYSGEDVSKGTQVWSITKGQSASFTITPNGGHRLQKLYKDGQDVTSNVIGGTYTVSNVQNDFTLEAVFVEGTEPQPQPTTQDKGTAKLSIEAFDIKAGETKTMLIDMQNPEDQVTMVQFDLRLPDGLSIATGDDAIDIVGRTTWKKHTLTSNATNGITRLLLYSGTNDVIEGTSGAIISIKIVASSSFNGGDIKLENQLMTTPVLVESKPATYTYNIKGESVNPPVGDAEPYAVYNDGVLTFYCDNQRSSRQGTAYDLNKEKYRPAWETVAGVLTKVIFDTSFAEASPTTTLYWFCQCHNLTMIEGMEYLNTSNVISMENMFSDCSSLTSLNVSNINTSNVTDMRGMFTFCSSLTNIIMGNQFTSNESTDVREAFYGCTKLSKVTFTGDIPASINSKFFEGVGTADAPAILDVPEQYKANYAAKFDGNKFYGGYFQLNGDNQEGSPLEITCKVLNAVDGIVYYSHPYVKMTWKNLSDKDFGGTVWYSFHKQLENGEWINNWRGSSSPIGWTLKSGESLWMGNGFPIEDGVYKVEWGYEEENGNTVSIGSTIIEVRGHDRYRAIWMDSDIDNGTMKTFCDEDNLDFSHAEGLKAYIATAFNSATSEAQMQQVYDASSGTGLLLVGQPGCYLAERVTSASTYSLNMLIGVLSETSYIKSKENGFASFIYNTNQKDNKQKFLIASDKGSIVSENEAYLCVPTQTAGDTQTITPVFDESTVSEEPYAVFNDFTLTFYCDDQRSSRVGKTYSLNEGEKEPDWVLDDNNRNVENVVFDASFAKARPTSTFQWFFYFDYLTEIKGIKYLNTSEVRNMRAMFFSCRRLKSVDVSHFDTRAVEDMGGMFSSCTSLESIDVSNFDTGNMFNLTSMFNNCQSLTELDLSNFNTSKADYLMYLFSGCSNLRTLYLGSGFTSTNSVECEDAFDGCQSLSKVLFTGDIPASINSEFFKGVGTADAPAKLDVPEQFEANFAAKFNDNMFYGGYFVLRETIVPNAEDGGKDYSSGNSEIDETTDLNGTIIGNVYYSIAPGDGGYNSAEGCLVVSKPSPDVDYDYEDPFDEEFKNMFTGIVIMVQPGSGTVKVEAETSEGMSLMVKIGNNLPIKMTLQTKSTLAIPYTVTRPTYVYIYAGGGNSTRVSSDGALKIYGFSWESSSTGINAPIATDDQAFDVYSLSGTMMKKGTRSLESLPKGVYIVNGRKFVKK